MNFISFGLFSLGFLLLIGFTLHDIPRPKQTLKRRIAAAKRPSPKNPLVLYYYEVKQILILQRVSSPELILWSSSLSLAVFGIALALLLDNTYLIPVFVCLFSALPLIVVKSYWNYQERQMSDTLEAALGMITTSYLRGNNTFLRAVEENIEQMQSPVQQVFRAFLTQATYVDSSITDALMSMKLSIHNDVCRQWISAVIRCQNNQTLKQTLPRILTKFSEERTVLGELALLLEEPKRTYFIMVGGSFFSPFLLYFLNRDWWEIVLYHPLGKLLVAFQMLTIAFSLALGIRAMTPSMQEGEHD